MEEIIKQIFDLDKEDILKIGEIINGYKETVNKSGKNNILIKKMYASGKYLTIKDFLYENKITKDHHYVKILFEKNNRFDIDDLLFFKNTFEMSDDELLQVIYDYTNERI